ncbi:MAG: hypothetical protein K2N56_09420 [Oscillospiraceae bacterium]|nr:hypothetical protein [Oscillospiraceae bacterium]
MKIFGFNLYIVQTDGFERAPKGSAVIVKKTTAYELDAGKLILYEQANDPSKCALGYVTEVTVNDGTYYLKVSDNIETVDVPESRLVGSADYSSVMVGTVISFIKTPFGIFCVAVMPCLALILYDIIRAAASRMPDPEVEPQLKNRSDEVVTQKNISVNSDGKAAYSRSAKDKNSSAANDVLFNYSPKTAKQQKPADRPIIPLTDKSTDTVKPMDISQNSVKKRVNPAAISRSEPTTPENVGISRYVQNSKRDTVSDDPTSKTAELPNITKETVKRDSRDAFFTQTSSPSAAVRPDDPQSLPPRKGQAPQIGRQIPKRVSGGEDEPVVKRQKTAGKRSTQILASKRVDDLISDDDDVRDKNRIRDDIVDDILSGIRK